MSDILEMLTLDRVRGIYRNEDGFSKLSLEDLYELRDWLDLVSDEVYTMKRAVMKEIGRKARGDESNQATT